MPQSQNALEALDNAHVTQKTPAAVSSGIAVSREEVERLVAELREGRTNINEELSTLRSNLNGTTDQFLGVTKHAAGEAVATKLVELQGKLRHIDPSHFSRRKGLFGLIGNKVLDVKAFFDEFGNIKDAIDGIVLRLEEEQQNLSNNQEFLYDLARANEESIIRLATMIEAAQEMLETPEGKQKLLESMGLSKGADDMLSPFDQARQESALDRRLTDMQGVLQVYQQASFQIFNAIYNNRELADAVERAANDILAIWKLNAALAVTNEQQSNISDVVVLIQDMSNQMLAENSKQQKENTLRIAAANERTTVDPKVLEQNLRNLEDTVIGLQQIFEKGAKERQDARMAYSKAAKALSSAISSTASLSEGKSSATLSRVLEDGPRSPKELAGRNPENGHSR